MPRKNPRYESVRRVHQLLAMLLQMVEWEGYRHCVLALVSVAAGIILRQCSMNYGDYYQHPAVKLFLILNVQNSFL